MEDGKERKLERKREKERRGKKERESRKRENKEKEKRERYAQKPVVHRLPLLHWRSNWRCRHWSAAAENRHQSETKIKIKVIRGKDH